MKKIPTFKTEWVDLKENPPPANVYLLLDARLAGTQVPIIMLGFYSERATTLINIDNGVAIQETLDVVNYSVVTDADGNYIETTNEFPAELFV